MKFTQEQRLENYLKSHKWINPLIAWRQLGIYRLSAVIFKLRDKGLNITTELVEVKNQFGETCRIAKYTLK